MEIKTAQVFKSENEIQEYLDSDVDYVLVGTEVTFFSNLGITIVTKMSSASEEAKAELDRERALMLDEAFTKAPNPVNKKVDFEELGFLFHKNIISNQSKMKALELDSMIDWTSEWFYEDDTDKPFPIEGVMYLTSCWASESDMDDENEREDVEEIVQRIKLYSEAMGDIFLENELEKETPDFDMLGEFFSELQDRKGKDLEYQTYAKYVSNLGKPIDVAHAEEVKKAPYTVVTRKLLVDGDYAVNVELELDNTNVSADGMSCKAVHGESKEEILDEISEKLSRNEEAMYDLFTGKDENDDGMIEVELRVGDSYCEYTLPDHWASYLVNSDPSGLEDEDIIEVDAFVESEMKKNKLASFHCVDVSEDSDFARSNDANNMGGDVSTYTFHTVSLDRLVKNVKDKNLSKRTERAERKANFGKQSVMEF